MELLVEFSLSLCLILAPFAPSATSAAKILALYPFPIRSHFLFVQPLLEELANRGHQVTVYSPFPVSLATSPPANYIHVHTGNCFPRNEPLLTIKSMHQFSRHSFQSAFLPFRSNNTLESMLECQPLMDLARAPTHSSCQPSLPDPTPSVPTEYLGKQPLETSHSRVSSSDQYCNYDLLMAESFNTDLMLMFAVKFAVPFVTTMPNIPFPWVQERIASPANPSYIKHLSFDQLPPFSFIERVYNTLLYWTSILFYCFRIIPYEDQTMRQILSPHAHPLHYLGDVIRNTSLVFINSHESINPAVPLVPQIIPVGGLHIRPPKELPKDIEKFINDSTEGVVYFCMGSILQGKSFPEEKRKAFLYAFSKIKQRVLWKWEGDVLPGQLDNIMISKWMPQRDILAHPNVKLFISHGGLLGLSEAIYEGVPVLGIPVFGDQRTNVKALEYQGAGQLLEYDDISKELVLEKIQKLLNDPKYAEKAKELSIRFRDRPMSPLDTAVYWTEYVIRHNGAHHLKTAAVHMPWYQYLLLDVIAFLISILLIFTFSFYYVIKFIFRCVCRKAGKEIKKRSKSTKVKKN